MGTFEDAEGLKLKVIQAIKQVYDPEIPIDIFELGLIYEINVLPINNVEVIMTLTSPSCPSAEAIPAEVEMKVREIPEVNSCNVVISWEPPYHQDMMSDAAKLELGLL